MKSRFLTTYYAVCTIQFTSITENPEEASHINTYIYPAGNHYLFELTAENNYTIGGEIYNLNSSNIKVERATHINEKSEFLTNILLKCIDDNINSQLGFKLVADEDRFIDKSDKLSAGYAFYNSQETYSFTARQTIKNEFLH